MGLKIWNWIWPTKLLWFLFIVVLVGVGIYFGKACNKTPESLVVIGTLDTNLQKLYQQAENTIKKYKRELDVADSLNIIHQERENEWKKKVVNNDKKLGKDTINFGKLSADKQYLSNIDLLGGLHTGLSLKFGYDSIHNYNIGINLFKIKVYEKDIKYYAVALGECDSSNLALAKKYSIQSNIDNKKDQQLQLKDRQIMELQNQGVKYTDTGWKWWQTGLVIIAAVTVSGYAGYELGKHSK